MKFLNYFSLSFLVYFFLILNTTSAQSKQSFQLRADGSIKVWTMLGPFPNGKGGGHSEGCIGYYTDFLRDEGGETKAIPSQGDTVIFGSKSKRIWKTEFSDDSGFLDFLRIFRVSTSVPYAGYAFCQLNSDEEKPAVFKISSDDGVRVWLNDKMVHDNHIGRGVDEGIDTVFVKLKRGDNRLLVKVDQGNGGWGLIFHVTGKNGSPLEGVTSVVSLPSSISGKILEANITSTDFVENTDEGSKQIIFADILSGGVKNTSCAVNIGERSRPLVTQIGDLSLGRHQVRITIPEISGNIKADFTFRYNGGKFAVKNVGLKKSREWTLYLVQHAHTDIGYTRPQHEILPEHLRYIDYALDMCDLTDSYPDDAKFRWTCEAAWTVREYLNRRPASQIERLKNRIKEGRIEVTGMFFNFSELPDENLMASSLKPVKKFKDEGIPVVAAMQNDVNGLAWCLVDYFSSIGIKYATMGINNDRSILPFNKPTAFWWESPSGNKLLAFRADHYMTGNSFGLQTGKIAKAEPAVSNYLKDLEKKQYPFSRIAVQFSGYVTDNSPPSLAACRLVKDWNEKYKWPHLRISTAREFLRYVENNHADELEVYKAAWPDWWTDGFASAARETGIVRNAQTAMIVNNSLLSMACLMGEKIAPTVLQRITQINDQLLFYDEHTFGAAESISDPYAQNSMLQWGEKSAFAYSALRESGMLREEAIGLLLGKISKDSVPSVCVFNTLNCKRSGIAEVFIDHEMLPSVSGYKIVDAETNQPAAHSLIKTRPEGNY